MACFEDGEIYERVRYLKKNGKLLGKRRSKKN